MIWINLSRGVARKSATRAPSEFCTGDYRNGCDIPFRENLQEISKNIQEGLQVSFKPDISSAVKHSWVCCRRV
jgi:hypothetical protein